MSGNLLDAYGRQARLTPALLTLFPIFVTVAAWMPALYKLATGLVGLAVACGVTTVFAHIARYLGRSVQNTLIEEWGGLPTTFWLCWSDENLESQTKRRYFNFLESNIPNWNAPTPKDEKANIDEAKKAYGSAVRWLLEYTRDTKTFSLIFKENISYGFRRNSLGLRPFAIALAFFASGFGIFRLYGAPASDLLSEYPSQTSAIAVSILLLVWWLFGVTRSWVKDAANAYARALLAVCDNQ